MITESRFLDLRSCQNSGPAVCVIFLEGPIYLELTVMKVTIVDFERVRPVARDRRSCNSIYISVTFSDAFT